MTIRRATLIGSTAILLWGALATLTVLSGDIPPFQLLAMSFALGTLVGVGWQVWRATSAERRVTSDEPHSSLGTRRSSLVTRRSALILLLGVYGLFGYHFAYFMALRLAPPVEAGLIAYLWPLLIVLLSALLPGERLGGRQVLGALLGFGGAALLVTRGQGLRFEAQYAAGYAFALVCAVIWSSYSVLSRLVGQRRVTSDERRATSEATPNSSLVTRRSSLENDSSRAVTVYCAATAVLALVCHLLLEETVWPAGGQWAAVVALGLGPVGAAFYTWDYGVKHGNIQTLGALAYAAPLLSTALLVAVGLAEASWLLAAACALIVGGAIVASNRG